MSGDRALPMVIIISILGAGLGAKTTPCMNLRPLSPKTVPLFRYGSSLPIGKLMTGFAKGILQNPIQGNPIIFQNTEAT
jgi:hypothetical protein